MFNSSLTDMKRNMASGQGTMYSIFAGGKLKQNDVTAITNYANAVKAGVKPTQAFKDNLGGCSVAAKRYVVDARRAGKSTDEMVTGLSKVPKATTAASVGMKALSVAGNMLLIMGVSLAIKGIIKGFDALITTTEEHQEQLQNLQQEYDEAKQNLEDVNSQISEYEKRINELQGKTLTPVEEEELQRIQNLNEQLKIEKEVLEEIERIKKGETSDKAIETINSKKGGMTRMEMIEDYAHSGYVNTQKEIDRIMSADYMTSEEKNYEIKHLREHQDSLRQQALEITSELLEEAKALDQNDAEAKELYDKIQSLSAETLTWAKDVDTAPSSHADKMTVSIGDLKSASDGLKVLGTAFKEMSDDGRISLDTLESIKTTFAGSVDDIDSYIDRLMKAKVGSQDFNSALSELTYGYINQKLNTEQLANADEAYIATLLKEVGVSNSAQVAQHMIAVAKEKLRLETQVLSATTASEINDLMNEEGATNATKQAIIELTREKVELNAQKIDSSDDIEELMGMAKAAGMAAESYAVLARLKESGITDMDMDTFVGPLSPAQQAALDDWNKLKAGEVDFKWDDITSYGYTPKTYYTNTGSGKSGSDKNKPDYEDPTDAIINRINLGSKVLEQQEEEIQNLIEIAQLEEDEAKQISLTNDLIATRKKRIEELNTANDSLHNAAQHIRNTYDYDEDSWFDSQGNATVAYFDELNKEGITEEEKELIKEIFEHLSKYKQAYRDNSEEILGLNKEILTSEKEIEETRQSIADDFLNELQTKLDDYYDIRISRRNSESSLLSTHFDLVNAIEEERHNLNKELLEAETIGARMNEQERESLFTKAEHTRLSGKLNDIMLDISDLQNDYMRDLNKATSDTIEEITNHYERQYELKMKEYEIVKAELSLAKAQQVLENTENEKSVRTWNGSNWVYEANLQDVIKAQEDVENAKYELARAQAEEAQQVALNAIDSRADALETEKNKLATAIDEIAEKMDGSGTKITDMLKTIAETDLPVFDEIIQSLGDSIKTALNISDDDIDSIRRSGGGVAITSDAIEQMKANSAAWHTADKDTQTKLSNANKAWGKALGLDYEDSTGRWKKKDGTYAYATGTRNAKKGAGLFDEDGFGSEVILTNDGILTQFNGGEHVFSPEMADRLWEMAQQNYTFSPMVTQPDIVGFLPLEDKINNAINNISNAFGDTYMVNGVQLSESEGGTLKGFMDFLKKKI